MARFARRESTKMYLVRLFLEYLGIWVCSRQLRGLISYCRASYCYGGGCICKSFVINDLNFGFYQMSADYLGPCLDRCGWKGHAVRKIRLMETIKQPFSRH